MSATETPRTAESPVEAAESAPTGSSNYDPAERRRSRRAQRQKGCVVYIPAVELERAGIDPAGPPPFYRTVGYQRSRNAHTVIVSLYTEP